MRTFKLTSLASALGIAMMSSGALAEANILSKGDFEHDTLLPWYHSGSTGSAEIITDENDPTNKILAITGRTKHSITAMQLVDLKESVVYQLSGLIKSEAQDTQVSMSVKFNLKDPTAKTQTIILDKIIIKDGVHTEDENGWMSYSSEFSFPNTAIEQALVTSADEIDFSRGFKITFKTATGTKASLWADDMKLVEKDAPEKDHGPRVYNVSDFTNDTEKDYFSVDLPGVGALEIMRATAVDNLVTPEDINLVDGEGNPLLNLDGSNAKETSSSEQIDTYIAENPLLGWNWATKEQLDAIRNFIASGAPEEVLPLLGGEWSPKKDIVYLDETGATKEQEYSWTYITPDNTDYTANPDGNDHTTDDNPMWKFVVKQDTATSQGAHVHTTNTASPGNAALLVRAANTFPDEITDELAIIQPQDITIEATGELTDVTLDTPVATGGSNPGEVTSDSVGSYGLGDHVITWSVTDDEKTVSVTQTVSIVDTTAPKFVKGDTSAPLEEDALTALEAVTIGSEGETTTVNLTAPMAVDIADSDVEVTSDAQVSYPNGSYDITWTAVDNAGNSTSLVQTISILDLGDPLEMPVAVLTGESSVDERGSYTLSATDSTVDERLQDGVIYEWTQLSGPDIDLSAATTELTFVAPTVTADTDLEFKLAVNDGNNIDETTHVVTISNVPSVSEASARFFGFDEGTPVRSGTEVKIDGSLSTTTEGELSYQWVETSGVGVELADADTATATFIVPEVSENTTITFELTVDNGLDEAGSVSVASISTNIIPTVEVVTPEEGEKNDLLGGAFGSLLGLLTSSLVFIRRKLK